MSGLKHGYKNVYWDIALQTHLSTHNIVHIVPRTAEWINSIIHYYECMMVKFYRQEKILDETVNSGSEHEFTTHRSTHWIIIFLTLFYIRQRCVVNLSYDLKKFTFDLSLLCFIYGAIDFPKRCTPCLPFRLNQVQWCRVLVSQFWGHIQVVFCMKTIIKKINLKVEF